MRVGSSGADEDGADVGCVVKVVGEGFAHGFGIAGEVKVVFADGEVDEVVDFWEGVFGEDEYGVEFGGQLGCVVYA